MTLAMEMLPGSKECEMQGHHQAYDEYKVAHNAFQHLLGRRIEWKVLDIFFLRLPSP